VDEEEPGQLVQHVAVDIPANAGWRSYDQGPPGAMSWSGFYVGGHLGAALIRAM
jgi:hypothetical protein